MNYEQWRISFQDSEQAARAAFEAWQAAKAQGGSEKLIHVGFTDENHIERGKTSVGRFYPDSAGGQQIPIYMMARHINRLNEKTYCYIRELEKQAAHLPKPTGGGVPAGWFAEVQDGQLCVVDPEGWSIAWTPHPKGSSHQDIAGRLIVEMLNRKPPEQEQS